MQSGFSLTELMMVIAVTVILTGLLFPVLSGVRETVHRVICASNLRQIGLGITMYARDNRDRIPYSAILAEQESPLELMAATYSNDDPVQWDGLGLLFQWNFISAPQCFYCPSHHGEHPAERYAEEWIFPLSDSGRLYTNFHYAGHIEWRPDGEDGYPMPRLRNLTEGERLILATDGFRTQSDFNHRTGMNQLRADGSIRYQDNMHEFVQQLPLEPDSEPNRFRELWDELDGDTEGH